MGYPSGALELSDIRNNLLNPYRLLAFEAFDRFHALQRPDELAEAVGLVAAAESKVIVEIGCWAGATLWAWRQLCERVYGITLPLNDMSYFDDHGAVVRFGDSHDPASLSWLRTQLAGDLADVLFIDGDHSYEGVDADFADYAPLVRPGGLVLVHDIANTIGAAGVVHWWSQRYPNHPSILSSKRPIGFGVITIEEKANA